MAITKNAWTLLVLLLALVAAVTVLALHGDIGGEAVVGFFTGLVGLIGGAGAAAHGVKQGSEATSSPPAAE